MTIATTPEPTVWLTLQSADPRALIDYLVGTLGFAETAVMRDGEEITHAQLAWPDGGGVMLGSYKPGAAWSREPGTAGGYIVCTDLAETYRRVVATGADIIQPLTDEGYGSSFAVRDPEGNLWSLGDYRGEPVGS
jgi:uncharacterized glyoxalase superfamily protein PhnB